jgi:hypothetical protein
MRNRCYPLWPPGAVRCAIVLSLGIGSWNTAIEVAEANVNGRRVDLKVE